MSSHLMLHKFTANPGVKFYFTENKMDLDFNMWKS